MLCEDKHTVWGRYHVQQLLYESRRFSFESMMHWVSNCTESLLLKKRVVQFRPQSSSPRFIWFQSVQLAFNVTAVVWTICNFKQGGFVSLSQTLFLGVFFVATMVDSSVSGQPRWLHHSCCFRAGLCLCLWLWLWLWLWLSWPSNGQ